MCVVFCFFFVKQKTAYEMCISDWSSDVCSSDLRSSAGSDTTIIDLLIAAEERGDALREAELVANAVLLLFAGHETTTNLFGNGMLALLRNPHQLARFAADPGLAAPAGPEERRGGKAGVSTGSFRWAPYS